MSDITQIIADCKREIAALKADKHVNFEQLNFAQYPYNATLDPDAYYIITARCRADFASRIPVATWSLDHTQVVGQLYPQSAYWTLDGSTPVLNLTLNVSAVGHSVPVTLIVEGFNLAGVDYSIRRTA